MQRQTKQNKSKKPNLIFKFSAGGVIIGGIYVGFKIGQRYQSTPAKIIGALVGGLVGGGIMVGIGYIYRYFRNRKIEQNKQNDESNKSQNNLSQKSQITQDKHIIVNKTENLEKKYDNLTEKKKQQKQKQIKNYINKAETQYSKQKCIAQIKREGKSKVIFIGNTGVGKSSLINKLYKTSLKTGKLQTTFGYEKVYNIQNTNIHIYDSQGYNQDNHDQQVKKWEQLNYYKIIFILYQDTLKASKTMIECLCKPKDRLYKTYFVCTKCDLWDDSNNKTIDQEIEQQRKYLKSIGIPDVDKIQFFKSSARKDKFEGGDNQNHQILQVIEQLKE